MLLGTSSLWGLVDSETTISGTPRQHPRRRKPPSVTYGSWMLAIDAAGELTEDEFLLFSAVEID